MKRSEFIAGFAKARSLAYHKQFFAGTSRPSELAMGLAFAKADAIRAWRTLDPASRAKPAAEFFSATVNQPDPGAPGDWTAKREAPTPERAQVPDLLVALTAAARHLTEYKLTEEVDSLSAAEAEIQIAIDLLPWLPVRPTGADVQSVAVKLRGDNDTLRSALGDAAEVLRVALAYHAEEFDGPPDQDLNVSGADLVDFFSSWREQARTSLATARRLIRETK